MENLLIIAIIALGALFLCGQAPPEPRVIQIALDPPSESGGNGAVILFLILGAVLILALIGGA